MSTQPCCTVASPALFESEWTHDTILTAYHLFLAGDESGAFERAVSAATNRTDTSARGAVLLRSPEGARLIEQLYVWGREHGARRGDIALLGRNVLQAASITDTGLAKHAEAIIEPLKRETGLVHWSEFTESMDPGERIQRCVGAAFMDHETKPEDERGLHSIKAIEELATSAGFLIGIYAREFQPQNARNLLDLMTPLRPLSPAVDAIAELVAYADGGLRGYHTRERRLRVLERVSVAVPGLDELTRDGIRLLTMYYLALEEAVQGYPGAADRVAPLDEHAHSAPLALGTRRVCRSFSCAASKPPGRYPSGSVMTDSLSHLEVLAIDAQASGASPEHGDLLELGWARCAATGLVGSVKSFWIVPRTTRPIRRAIRELTGWTEACLAGAIDERAVWANLRQDAGCSVDAGSTPRIPTIIHFARFEIPFLEDLHRRLGDGGDFPFETVCLHAVAARLFPDLPRRNIRALAGYLGHAPDLVRRSGGHVEATAFIWQSLLPILEGIGIGTWSDLRGWTEPRPSSRRAKRVYPYSAERRRALPDRPGVYRFVRRNGDVVYVGKATSLKKRIAGHFKSRGPATERSLELLSQVQDIDFTETDTLLEAALLECDEIKRLDPPYNVQLRTGDRSAWFSTRDFRTSSRGPDARHSVGPLPSERALLPLPTLIALSGGAIASRALRAAALAVPVALLPDDALFAEGWRIFSADHLSGPEPDTARRVHKASLALWLARGRVEIESNDEEGAPDDWDVARVRRRLERSLVQTGLLVRRARFLVLLADSIVAFRERANRAARCIEFRDGKIVAHDDLDEVSAIVRVPAKRPRSFHERQRAFDVATYDRLRVLLTELLRVLDEGGDIGMRVGSHAFVGERLRRIVRRL